MIRDPLTNLQIEVTRFLKSQRRNAKVEIDGIISSKVPWRPHVLENDICRGWYLHTEPPTARSWADRIDRALGKSAKFRVGVTAQEKLLLDQEFLDLCHSLNASIIEVEIAKDKVRPKELYATVEDLIYQRHLILSAEVAEKILDRSLARAKVEKDKNRKGVLLELLVAVLLSQVEGFEVTNVDISNRTQQMDVMVHNRNVGGSLGNSPVVLAEAKNWGNSVGTTEYAAFLRKLQNRHRRARLGYLVTTGKFTSGVTLERRRESNDETLVVFLDGASLPALWRGGKSITQMVERATLDATVGV